MSNGPMPKDASMASTAAPDMLAYLNGLKGQTVFTVAQNKPNKIVDLTEARVLIETETGDRNWAPVAKLQDLANGVYAGEVVEVPKRERSAFNVAVLVTLPGIAYALNPRRVWLEGYAALDAEFDELDLDDETRASEGRLLYRRHRIRERSASLVRAKKAEVLARTGHLACEACGFDFGERFPGLGEGFIECHHLAPLSEAGERESTLDDLAVVCPNCHRMLHRSLATATIEELRHRLASQTGEDRQ